METWTHISSLSYLFLVNPVCCIFVKQAHPLACAASLAVQNVIEEEKLLENIRIQGTYLGLSVSIYKVNTNVKTVLI